MKFEQLITHQEFPEKFEQKEEKEKIIFDIIFNGRKSENFEERKKYRELLNEKIQTGIINREYLNILTKQFSIQENYSEKDVLRVDQMVDFLIPANVDTDKKRGTIIETFQGEEEKKGGQEIAPNFIQINDVLVPTYGNADIKAGDGSFKKQIIPRIKYLIEFLNENHIFEDQYLRIRGKNLKTMLRQESYEMFIIPLLKRMILVCNEEGNSTFVINKLSETPQFYYSLAKDQLKYLRDSELIDQIDWTNPNQWKEDVFDSLTKPRETDPEKFTEEEIKEKLNKIKQEILKNKKEKKELLSFNEARGLVRGVGFKNVADYRARYKEYPGLPANPDNAYKDKGWKDWNNFFGKEKKELLPFDKARELARSIGFKSIIDYRARYKEYPGLPRSPAETYKDKGWKSWYDFLGKEKKELLPFDKARELARSVGFKNKTDYHTRYKKYPELPSNPAETYKNKGWKDLNDFLGNKNKKFYPLMKHKN